MFFLIYNYINTSNCIINVLRYTSFRIAIAFLTSLLLTIFIFPYFIKKLKTMKINQRIRNNALKKHLKKSKTPTMGGLLILISLSISVLLWADLSHIGIWLLLFLTLSFGFIGFYDDYKKIQYKNSNGISAKKKLLLLSIISIITLTIYSLNFKSSPFSTILIVPFIPIQEFKLILPIWIYLLFALFLIIATSNSVNITDGLDGLAIGPIIISAFIFLFLSYITGNAFTNFKVNNYLYILESKHISELGIFCAAIIGSGIGFLWYNAYPALIFMGDVGSLSLGGALGLLAILTKNELLSGLLHGLFAIEALSVIIQIFCYRILNKRIFKMAPIHHHFELSGCPESRIVMRFWIFSVIFALLALSSLKW